MAITVPPGEYDSSPMTVVMNWQSALRKVSEGAQLPRVLLPLLRKGFVTPGW
jgi:hypothetical protein